MAELKLSIRVLAQITVEKMYLLGVYGQKFVNTCPYFFFFLKHPIEKAFHQTLACGCENFPSQPQEKLWGHALMLVHPKGVQ